MARPVEELERTWNVCRRIDFYDDQARLAGGLLEPIASLVGAETAVFRAFSALPDAPRLMTLVGLGIPDSVHDAYIERYSELDPARRLLTQRFTKPLFADRFSRGEWLSEHATIGDEHSAGGCLLQRHREEFRRYREEFLLPNGFCHHVGFCFQDVAGGHTFVLNLHRPVELPPFDRLERARAKVISVVLHAKAAQFRPAVRFDERHRGYATTDDRDLLAGEACYGADAAPHRAEESRSPLSARELEVAEAVALGLANKEVAAALSISVRTVENHMRSIFAKLQISTRTRLAAKLHGLRSGASAALGTAYQSRSRPT